MSYTLINQYRRDLDKILRYGGSHNEGAVRIAFANLLKGYCQGRDFQLVEEINIKSKFNTNIRPDGIVKDALRLDWGYWEAKDEKDNLAQEIDIKINEKGYPTENILFQDNQTAVLIQNDVETLRIEMENDADLDRLLNQFLDYERAEVRDFRSAIASFSEDLPTILNTLRNLIDEQGKSNNKYIAARDKFLKVCQDSISLEINIADIREMMIQHILTEDIFTNIFSEGQFHQENNIASQLQEVLKTFFTRDVKRNTLKTIQSYYQVIIRTAGNIVNHHEKQKFLKVVYENFYKTYNPLAADRLGIVYTPNEIVKFMVESTDYLLNKHFQKSLGDKGVEILDPATGTGTFITEILEYLLTRDIEYKYKHEIHCNEISILPYYIANLNIEYTYKQRMGEYLEFENICLVDTLDSTDIGEKQLDVFAMTQENTERIKRQNERQISVIIGNPPYNANQQNENDNNKNREYPEIDKRIKDTYVKESTAQKTKVYDMYARFLRWATDRLNNDGIIAFITNSSFIDAKGFDGFRKCLAEDFNDIYVVDLKGNIRAGEKTGNVFNIMIGVAITFLIKQSTKNQNLPSQIVYFTPENVKSGAEKLDFLAKNKFDSLNFARLIPDKNYNWINQTDNDFDELLPLMDKDVKSGKSNEAIFQLFSLGIASNRDEWVYDFDQNHLTIKVKYFCEVFEQEKIRWNASQKDIKINDFVDRRIKWTSELESYLLNGVNLNYQEQNLKNSLYRPYVKKNIYFDKVIIHRLYQQDSIFTKTDNYNKLIGFMGQSTEKPFSVISSNLVPDLNCISPASGGIQCLPLYRYENGERRENITDWGLLKFQENYQNKNIRKEDIFNYIYAVLHNPEYRQKYELNLKREFPRIPFYDNFEQWVNWGKKLMNLHLNYETIKPDELKRVDTPLKNPEATPKVKLKADKIQGKIILDELTTLENIPKIAWEYKLGNRSALEWILDQYKEKKPKDKTIAEKFNNYKFADYKEQVIDLLMRVCTVSVETMNVIEEMEKLPKT